MNPAFTDLAFEWRGRKGNLLQMRKQAARQMDVSKDLIKKLTAGLRSDSKAKCHEPHDTWLKSAQGPTNLFSHHSLCTCLTESDTTSGTRPDSSKSGAHAKGENPLRGWAWLLSCPTPEHMIWVTAGARRCRTNKAGSISYLIFRCLKW